MLNKNKRIGVRVLLIAYLLAATACVDKPADSAVDDSQEKVIVIGAGLAGLNTALLLEQNGFSVTMLEARQRIGGRLYTLDDVPGRPEAGGNTIGPNYARVIDRAAGLGLELVPAPEIIGGMRSMLMYIDGEFIQASDWAASKANPFPARLKQFSPEGMIFGALRENPLQEPADWMLAENAKFDVPLVTVFDRMGLNARSKDLVNQTNSYGDSLQSTSLLQMYRILATYAKASSIKGRMMAVSGGNQRLPEAMAKAVKGKVLTGKVVTQISQTDTAVEVKTADGSVYKADYAVSTIPLTAMRNIAISPPLPALQQQAIDEIDYSKTLVAQLTVAGNYWGEQGPSLWTDTPIERIFATSLGGSAEVSNVTLWLTGDNSMQFSKMDPAQRDAALLAAFYQIYPQAKGKVKLEKVVDWNSDPLIKGTWPAFKPGQMTAFAQHLSKPAGRLYFAGEHTAVTNTGMEAAMESSERVVTEMLRGNANASAEHLFVVCSACHSLAAGQPHKLGPNLHGFFGQAAASREGYDYSEALQKSKIRWDKNTLAQWLKAPETVVPGNKMIYRSQLTDDEINQLVDYLAAHSEGE